MTQEVQIKEPTSNITRVELAGYQTPSIVELTSKEVVYFGEDNLFPFDLIDLYNDSPTHNAIVNGKIGYICGRGFTYSNPSNENEFKVSRFLKNANPSENWNELVKKLATDYEIHNTYAIEVLRQKDGTVEYHHMDVAKIRRSIDVNFIWFSDEWMTDKGKKSVNPEKVEVPIFNKNVDVERSVIIHADYRPNMDWYALPIYQGSLAAIKTDVEINNFWLCEILNGFSSGTLISLNNGVPDEPKQKKISDKFKKKATGSSKAGELLVSFSSDKEHEPTVLALNGNDLDKRYSLMADAVQQNIFIGHRVTSPMLFGVKSEGQLGGRNEIAVAYEMFTKTYVEERQQPLERTVNNIMGMTIGIVGIKLEGLEPVELGLTLSDEVIVANLDRDEIREMIAAQTGIELKTTQLHKMSADDEEKAVINLFEKYGDSQDDFNILASFDIDFDLDGNPRKVKFVGDLSEIEIDILNAIKENGQQSQSDLSELLDVPLLEIRNIVASMEEQKLIGKTDGVNLLIFPDGAKTLKTGELPTEQKLKIKYQYVKRDDAPALKPGGKSRNFCRALLSMNKLWSREQIDLMRNDMDSSSIAPQVTNVWLSRGGWYNDPSKGVATPFCRHVWKQVVVIDK